MWAMEPPSPFVFDWPSSWDSAEALRRLEGTVFRTLLLDKASAPKIRAQAEAKGYRCVVEGEGGFRWRPIGEMDWANPGPCVAVNEVFWPAVSAGKESADGAGAGPTGSPWLDANGWVILLARARAKGRPVWLRAKEPDNPSRFEPVQYRLALAEACAYGAVRPVWLTPQHAAGQPAWWNELVKEAAWWCARTEWQSWPVSARLSIVSDFTGPNEYLGTETLLLAARRNLAFHAVPLENFGPSTLRGQKAILWLDPTEPPPSLASFVQAGGLLICRKTSFAGKPARDVHERFRLLDSGKGRIAVATQDWDDPWILARDVHLLVSRRWDPVKLFNQGLLQHHVVESKDGSRRLVHLINYAGQPSWNLVTMLSDRPFRSAVAHIPGAAEPQKLEVQTVSGRQELVLPRFPIAMTVELEQASHA